MNVFKHNKVMGIISTECECFYLHGFAIQQAFSCNSIL